VDGQRRRRHMDADCRDVDARLLGRYNRPGYLGNPFKIRQAIGFGRS
jgi:hypothetical protein